MNTTTTTIAKPRAGGHGCGCGCSDHKGGGECCGLECLVQPRFFCGQLLTDQDLSVLLDWVKGKAALSRYRHGWGVVCGLEVVCGAEGLGEGHITAMPGYAVDCCGNDIVVCEKAALDLSQFCRPEQDPCAARPAEPAGGAAGGGGPAIRFGGWEVPGAEVQAVDIYVRYAETVADARTALARGSCAPAETCEYTRTREGYELYAKRAEHCDHDADERGESWDNGFKARLADLIRTLQRLEVKDDHARSAAQLSQWLKSNPLHTFCFVREWVCSIQRGLEENPASNPPEQWFDQAAFWIVQDWRNRHLRCDCEPCGPEPGVPLARVWLWRQTDAQRRRRCKVIHINSYPPFRRPVQQDCWPAPPDRVSLARFIWQPADYVKGELRKLNFDDFRPDEYVVGTLNDLLRQFETEVLSVEHWGQSGTSLVLHVMEDVCGQSRVVYFADKPQRFRRAESRLILPDDAAAGAGAADTPTPAPGDPAYSLLRVSGIGDKSARLLRKHDIRDLRELAEARPDDVRKALSSLPINPPDEARSQAYIDSARRLLDEAELSARGSV